MKLSTRELMLAAWRHRRVIPAFNIPYLPIMEAVVSALRETDTIGLIEVARPEWEKFEAKSIRAVREEYARVGDERYTRLHLDHVPVIDEDQQPVDYMSIIREAVELGYESVMVDGSRLPLEENIRVTRKVSDLVHDAGMPLEAELGSVLGHESGPLPPYEELFATRRGFTVPEEAGRFVKETKADWLSVSFGSVHGAISGVARTQQKVAARLDIEHLDRLNEAAGIPLVLHGGSGIRKEYVLEAVQHGIAKINIGIAVRQPYEREMEKSIVRAQDAAYRAALAVIRDDLETGGSADVLHGT